TRDDIALPVENDETRTRGSLVDGTDKLRHGAGSSVDPVYAENEFKRNNMKLKLEHFQQKCEAVLRRIMRKNKEIDRFLDSAGIRPDLNESPGMVGSGASIYTFYKGLEHFRQKCGAVLRRIMRN
ncbi:hypothetical protein, partial [Enterococcus faecium]|uniref:hypothetical protein n=1 Tax=Enterococcus faecium TaxID=1352 RepID=UPI0039E39A5F